jgi:hypothetical protein
MKIGQFEIKKMASLKKTGVNLTFCSAFVMENLNLEDAKNTDIQLAII